MAVHRWFLGAARLRLSHNRARAGGETSRNDGAYRDHFGAWNRADQQSPPARKMVQKSFGGVESPSFFLTMAGTSGQFI
jgi:hypothetical protein